LIGRLFAALGRVQAWAWVGGVLGVILIWLAVVSQPQPIPGTFTISNAEVALVGGPEPPKSVKLPHIFDDEKPPWQGDAIYSLDWPATLRADTTRPLALYMPRTGARFRVWLNGKLVAEEAWDTPGYVDTSVAPHLVTLPAELVKPNPADNRLIIEVRGQLLRKSGLAAPSIGPREAMTMRYERVYWWQVSATWMVAACSALLAMLAALMWRQGYERVFALLAAASAAWTVRLVLTPAVNPHMPFELWFYLHKLSFTVYCGFLYLFLWDLFDFRQGAARRVVVALLYVGPFWLGLVTLTGNYNLYRAWTGVLVAVSTLTMAFMIRRARWGLDGNQRLMVVVGVVTLITGLRDFLVVQLNWAGDGDLRWMTPGSLVFMLTLGWVLVQRTSNYLVQIGQLNHNLELRVNEKESELRAAFDQLRNAERRQVLEDERKRLTRDMHDGLGSQLVHTLNVVRTSDKPNPAVVAGMLNHALEELRMTLDSLEPLEGDLPTILGTLRRRISPALEAAGIELEWQVEEVPAITVHGQDMESRGVMHLFRCLQEVFANILKHAEASRVIVRTWEEEGRAMLSVSDNGKGAGDGFREGGRGLGNIRLRAAEIGATVRFDDTRPGTCVLFRFASNKPAGAS
jgi:signal transduction histidine kinase